MKVSRVILVKNVSEEYKLSIMECMVSLCKSLSWDLVLNIYTKNNAPKLCQMLYVAIEMAKKESFRKLRYDICYAKMGINCSLFACL